MRTRKAALAAAGLLVASCGTEDPVVPDISLAVGDLNGDGVVDFVSANRFGGNVSVLVSTD